MNETNDFWMRWKTNNEKVKLIWWNVKNLKEVGDTRHSDENDKNTTNKTAEIW